MQNMPINGAQRGPQVPLDPKKELVQPDEMDDEIDDGEDMGFSDDEADEKNEREKPITKYVFYDFETRQEQTCSTNEHGEVYAHEPNLCIAHIVCQLCMDQPLGHCQNCGPNRRVFKGFETANRFCEFMFDMKHVIGFAHNAQGFDGHFIMQYLQKQDLPPKIITRGLKIISLQVGSVRLIDSFNFLPMALSARAEEGILSSPVQQGGKSILQGRMAGCQLLLACQHVAKSQRHVLRLVQSTNGQTVRFSSGIHGLL